MAAGPAVADDSIRPPRDERPVEASWHPRQIQAKTEEGSMSYNPAKVWMLALISLVLVHAAAAQNPPAALNYESPYFKVALAGDHPAFVALAVDSLGNGRLQANLVRPPVPASRAFRVRSSAQSVEYRSAGESPDAPPSWAFEFSRRELRIRSSYNAASPPEPLVAVFNPWVSHATLLGMMNRDASVRLPAVLHFPDQGTFRITLSEGSHVALGYDAARFGRYPDKDYVRVTFPAASPAMPVVEYTLKVVDIYPGGPGLAGDPRFDGFRRNFLNIFQLNPRHRMLANNAASDPCALNLYFPSAVAVHTPPLAKGLTALDLVRETLDQYLSGKKGCGQVGYRDNPQVKYDFLDSYPSLLTAASDYVSGSNDLEWLRKNYPALKEWTAKVLAMMDKNGLLSYPASGNSGSWPEKIVIRPANWWDTIGFGHEDAYSNALAYHALRGMAELARRMNRPEDVRLYASKARAIRSVYVKTFYDPATGVLAGWKSADGKLHDYYFTFVSGVAITYGLVPGRLANRIMDHMLAKMKAVGYTHFQYGLPGNLIPVRPEDYVDHSPRFGYNAFQVYENGGATADFEYFTLRALYKLGRRKQADAMLFPLLRAYEAGGFQGKGPNGMTKDWKAWDGTPHGYEGLLIDNYLALLAVLYR
ncbi:MAG: hypothetical protein M1404_07655 [Acidobacteria bacterium]|nr:hypothetical protein [Acidobacteriota bacterium]